MNILITGASGFIGTNLLEYLKINELFLNENIILLSSIDIKPYKCINHKNYTFSKKDFIENGITDIDIVLHMGAFIPKTSSDANNVNKTMSNISNTIHLLNNLPNIPQKVIFISTIDVYEDTNDKIDESKCLNPPSLYGWSKLTCEKVLDETAKQMGFIHQILRVGHIYGKGEEKYKKLIPETMKKVICNQKPVIFSDGKEKRSFLHVNDCCHAIFSAIELKEYVGPINIVTNKSLSIEEYVKIIIDVSDKDIGYDVLDNKNPVRSLVFSNDKMQKHLCSEIENIYDGLKNEYEYLKARYND